MTQVGTRSGTDQTASDPLLRLATFLYHLTAAETVREREAAAAAIVNAFIARCRKEQVPAGDPRRSTLLIDCVPAIGHPKRHAFIQPDDTLFASCLRIARRALTGALRDPTGGSVRFHELGSRPVWAINNSPRAWIGSLLFYGEPGERGEPEEPACVSNARKADALPARSRRVRQRLKLPRPEASGRIFA